MRYAGRFSSLALLKLYEEGAEPDLKIFGNAQAPAAGARRKDVRRGVAGEAEPTALAS